jgi:hypothetical protein
MTQSKNALIFQGVHTSPAIGLTFAPGWTAHHAWIDPKAGHNQQRRCSESTVANRRRLLGQRLFFVLAAFADAEARDKSAG